MGKLVLVRHGQSAWNLENRFTGWVDVPLSQQGMEEACQAGERVKSLGLNLTVAHTSRLMRAQLTLEAILKLCNWQVPVWIDSALNERHYGDLQGMNKDEARARFGEEQVHVWRRSFDVPPPNGECLADCAKRTLPYFKSYVLPRLMAGEDVLIVAHGNSLRSIVMFLEGMTPDQILQFEMATGVPHVYEISSEGQVSSRLILS
jgi:2,3-bisphosphoglycerate-dependent phosphoglycerate mutase